MSIFPKFPNAITWEITNKCNLKCLHCYVRHNPEKGSDLNTDTIMRIIEQLDKGGTFSITLTGGEPTLRQDFEHIVKELRKRNFHLSLITNGTVTDKRKIEFIAHNFDFIKVSLDAPVPEIHDFIRGKKGAFNTTLNFIKELNKYNSNYTVAYTINKINKDYIEEFISFASSIKIKRISFGFVTPYNYSDEEVKELVLSPKEVNYIRKKLWILRKKYKHIIKIRINFCDIFDKISNIHQLEKILYKKIKKGIKYPCGAGITTCAISAEGYILPCIVLNTKDFRWGNVLNNSIESIWNGPKAREWRILFKKIPYECTKCKYLGLCKTVCRASVLAFSKKIDDLHPYCPKSFLNWVLKFEYNGILNAIYKLNENIRWRK